MKSTSENSKRIAKNTMLLYIRMLLLMVVSLYTSRIILNALGVEDFGIYNVVGGVVTMFSFLKGTIAAATQRFLSYAIGKEDNKLLQDTFNQTLIIHVGIAILIILAGESIGYWFIAHKLNIPVERISAAIWVFHCSLLALSLNIIQIPYNAMIIAQEKMNVYAYLSIIEAALKLFVALSIVWFSTDKLELYASLILIVGVITAFLYANYCRIKFQTKLQWIWDKALCKQLTGFAGWNLSAQIAFVARTQGVNILLNLFFGPVLNAARGLAVQVNGAVTSFVSNFQMATNPQIVKSYAQGNLKEMRDLVYSSSKFSFLLLSMLVIPLYLECESVLMLWLKNIPKYATIFTQLTLISLLADTLSGTLGYGALATGNIKRYQLTLSLLFLLNPTIVYTLFKLGASPTTAYMIEISFNLIALGFRLYFLHRLINISIQDYLKKVTIPSLIVLLFVCIIAYLIQQTMNASFFRIIIVSIVSVCSMAIGGYFIAMNTYEKKQINKFFKKITTNR